MFDRSKLQGMVTAVRETFAYWHDEGRRRGTLGWRQLRMTAFRDQRGLPAPVSAAEFYRGLAKGSLERDGISFTPEQAPEYDRRRLQAERVEQLAIIVTHEHSAIQWLRRELDPTTGSGPQTYQELQPKFLRELHESRHEKQPELGDLLEENFLQDKAERWYVLGPQKQEDLERLRDKSLLREFNTYLKGNRRPRVFHTEAIRAGFSKAWKEPDCAMILKVAERLSAHVIEEDPSLLMYVDNARLRSG